MKILIVVDMQNDFITGALANPAAEKIITKIKNYISNWDGYLIFTRDTHYSDYLDTMEGKNLPIPHCIEGSKGWEIHDELEDAAYNASNICGFCWVNKPTFGYVKGIKKDIDLITGYPTSIEICGTCTDICVISNVLGLKEAYPECKIIVHEDMCAGLTPEKHNAAIEVMKSCQVNII